MSVYLIPFRSKQQCTIHQKVLYFNIMNEELTCKICMKRFRFQFAREFHFDVVHNYRVYMCQTCENSEYWEDKGFSYTYFELLDHWLKVHNEDPFKILSYLNVVID